MIKQIETQILSLIAILVLSLSVLASSVSAAQLTSGSLLLSDPRPGQSGVAYTFSASTFTTGTSIRCIDLVFSVNSDESGGSAGTTTSSTFTSSTAFSGTWTPDNSTAGTVRLESAAGVNPVATGNIVLGGFTNPATEVTSYLNVTTYSDAGCSVEIDNSRVAYVTKVGEPVTLTIDPTLTFVCAAVASGTVNGASITTASTASGIDFGNFTSGTSGVSAHDLTVTTNAANGYTVSIRNSGLFSNGTDNIDPWTGTNAAPTTSFPTATEAWGYTTQDTTLIGGTGNRFTTPANSWAGFSLTNEPVISNTGAVSAGETVRVGHQVSIAPATPTGTYQTTIIYTVASVY